VAFAAASRSRRPVLTQRREESDDLAVEVARVVLGNLVDFELRARTVDKGGAELRVRDLLRYESRSPRNDLMGTFLAICAGIADGL
jgi:hypothetical protein